VTKKEICIFVPKIIIMEKTNKNFEVEQLLINAKSSFDNFFLLEEKTKFCARCNNLKLKSEFHVDNSRKDKCKHSCKECMKKYRFNENYQRLEKLRNIKNKDKNSILNKERINKYKQEYLIKTNELKKEIINNNYKEIPFIKNYFINEYGVICTHSSFKNFHKYKKCSIKIIPQRINIHGYMVLSIKKEYRVHQLVAATFLNHKIDGFKAVVDHVDGNKLNNHVSNLQIVTQFQNLIKGRYYKSKDPKWLKWIESIRY
jgi:hypothetical protein